MSTVSGHYFQQYRILDQINQNAIWTTLLADDAQGRQVVLRVINEEFGSQPAIRAGFLQIAPIVSRFQHPNVVPVLEADDADGWLFMVSADVGGQLLLIRPGNPTDPIVASRIVSDVASAASYAHARGITHGWIRPGEIIIQPNGDAMIGNFGVAGLLPIDPSMPLSVPGISYQYLSPDRLSGGPATPAGDCFSLGVMLFQLLTGRMPYKADTIEGIAAAREGQPFPSPSSIRPGIPPALDQIVLRAVSKNPANRFEDAGTLHNALERVLSAAGYTRLPPAPKVTPTKTVKAPRQTAPAANLPGVVIPALVALLMCCAGFGSVWLLTGPVAETVTAAIRGPVPTTTEQPLVAPTPTRPAASQTAGATPAVTATRPAGTPPASPSATSAPASSGTAARPATGNVVANPQDLMALVNKTFELPSSYVPPDLSNASGAIRPVQASQSVRAIIMEPLRKMVEAMRAEGLDPAISSGYRSYNEQVTTFNYWVGIYGQKEAERVSARPGHSEHQLGTAVDFAAAGNGYALEETFATTKEGKWLAQKARDFGFILRYPSGKEGITGYAYEPWHFRYIGNQAKTIEDRGMTLDELLAPSAR